MPKQEKACLEKFGVTYKWNHRLEFWYNFDKTPVIIFPPTKDRLGWNLVSCGSGISRMFQQFFGDGAEDFCFNTSASIVNEK